MPKEPTRERKTHLECVNKRKVTLRLKENLLREIPLNMYHREDLSVSNKLSFIVYIVDIMIKEGHKILIFSQSPGMLVLIQNALESIMEKQEIIRMDGSTKRSERNKLRKAFQRGPLRSPSRDSTSKRSPPSSSSSGSTGSSTSSSGEHYSKPCESWSTSGTKPLVFLMTTRVGGVGLNLTQASRVIIVDPSDNPSEDNQAVDRAYRYGQKNDVVVYRLMSCSDIEEHMYRSQVVKVESSIALLEEPCVRQISQRVGLVLKLPPQGFDTCRTHSELSNLYANSANKFDILPSDLGIKHDSVVAISNHSLLFSEKEVQLTEAVWLAENDMKELQESKAKKNILGITPSNQMLSTQIQISENVAIRLIKDKKEALTQIKQAVRRRAMISFARTTHGHPQLLITGDTVKDKEKAVSLIEDFIEKVSLEKRHIIYIPKDKTGLVIGTRGKIIESIRKESDADVQVTVPERKDLVGQNAVIISGENFNTLVAKELILIKLRKHQVPYTEEGCDT
ncbi:hypothetical protein BDA96_04G077200 [Sorghum bicolor]|uniref:Helicase C-terminal domain-containing protein n=1 Tax=Sorghum bicolor TaxID=4558 RepID=A0A921R2D6_SORBI|nr:hypothetical protein BDA96_04G077200 [Sorghum bicolor]